MNAFCAGLLLVAFAFGEPQGDASLAPSVAELSSPDAAIAQRARVALASRGDEAVRAVLVDFPSQPLEARRARARFAAHAIDDANANSLAPLADDPDLEVRRAILAVLDDPRLRSEAVREASVAIYASAARRDPDLELRKRAIAGLARIDLDRAADELARLIDESPEPECVLAARALCERPRARARVVARVQSDFAGSGRDSTAVLVALLDAGYGQALAENPNGGESEIDLAPFVLGARHASSEVRDAAASALDEFVTRLRFLGQVERAERAFDRLLDRGLDDRETLLKRARLSLESGKDPASTLAPARELARRLGSSTEAEHRRALAGALILEGAAEIACEHPELATPAFDRAANVLDGLVRDALDRYDPKLARLQAQSVETRAVVELWRGFAKLAGGASATDPAVLEFARRAHRGSLSVQAVSARDTDAMRTLMANASDPILATLGQESFDNVIGHRLSPLQLILVNDRGGGMPHKRRVDLAIELCRALAAVAPDEMLGLDAPSVDSELADWRTDPERGLVFEDLRAALAKSAQGELDRLNSGRGAHSLSQQAEQRKAKLELELAALGSGWPQTLASARSVSEYPYRLAAKLRADGRYLEARAATQKILDALERWDRRRSTLGEDLVAINEVELGGTYTDEGDGAKADEILNRALQRFEAFYETASNSGFTESGLRGLRISQADTLTSLAVNANVKLRDPAKALAYFERAIALDRNELSNVLLACYRARAGRADEARALLRDIAIAPANYYNLACTYALLGDKETALDFLQREFTENQPNDGARGRQKVWARTDPDLESLRGDPRFDALLK